MEAHTNGVIVGWGIEEQTVLSRAKTSPEPGMQPVGFASGVKVADVELEAAVRMNLFERFLPETGGRSTR
jgi:hypothetical protein